MSVEMPPFFPSAVQCVSCSVFGFLGLLFTRMTETGFKRSRLTCRGDRGAATNRFKLS